MQAEMLHVIHQMRKKILLNSQVLCCKKKKNSSTMKCWNLKRKKKHKILSFYQVFLPNFFKLLKNFKFFSNFYFHFQFAFFFFLTFHFIRFTEKFKFFSPCKPFSVQEQNGRAIYWFHLITEDMWKRKKHNERQAAFAKPNILHLGI